MQQKALTNNALELAMQAMVNDGMMHSITGLGERSYLGLYLELPVT